MARLIQERVSHMSTTEYDYHFNNAGDDPTLSCSVLRVSILAFRWFFCTITPREEDELINNLIWMRQCWHGR